MIMPRVEKHDFYFVCFQLEHVVHPRLDILRDNSQYGLEPQSVHRHLWVGMIDSFGCRQHKSGGVIDES